MNDLALFTTDDVSDLQRHWLGLLRALLVFGFTPIQSTVPLTDVQDQRFSFSLLIQLSRVKLGQLLRKTETSLVFATNGFGTHWCLDCCFDATSFTLWQPSV